MNIDAPNIDDESPEIYVGDNMFDMFVDADNAEDCIREIDVLIETLKSLKEVVERKVGAC